MTAYKDTERKTWYVKFRYRDWRGAQKWKTKRGFATKAEAVRYEANFKAESRAEPDMTFDALLEAYIKDRRTENKEYTCYTSERMMKRYIEPFFTGMKLKDIGKRAVREWELQLMETVSPYTKRKLSDNTLKDISRGLSSIFNFGMKYYDLPKNPLREIGGIGKLNKRQRFLTEVQFKEILKYIKREDARLGLSLIFYSGIRFSEFAALTAGDFDFAHDTVRIDKSLSRLGAVTTPKTESSNREIPLPPSIIVGIRKYIDSFYEVPEPLFALNRWTMAYTLKQAAKKAGLPHVSPHDLRHSHASHLIQLGVPITVISKRLGHSSPKITLDTYSHAYEDTARDVAQLLENSVELDI